MLRIVMASFCHRPPTIAILLAATLFAASSSHAAAPPKPDNRAQNNVENHYWDWGVGLFYAGLPGPWTKLDAARADWLLLRFPDLSASKATTEHLNELLELNPELKIVIRVWPVQNFYPSKGKFTENTKYGRGNRFIYDYFFAPGVKEKALAETRRQVRVVLDHITKPENVVGMTVSEEMPQHLTDMGIFLNDGETNWAIEAYRKEIEADYGKPFVWNHEARRWWCRKYVQMFDELHEVIKEASGGKNVLYWQQTGYINLDHLDAVPHRDASTDPFSGKIERLIPIRLAEIVKPGLCDGVFGYPNTDENFEADVLRFARERNWLFFSQLSHPCFMRLEGWDANIRRITTPVPQNLGTVWFCMGSCGGLPGKPEATNFDPNIPLIERRPFPPPADGFGGPYGVQHSRRVFAQLDVGTHIVEQHLVPELALDYQLAGKRADQSTNICLQVHNTKEPSWYLDPQDAVLRNVRVQLTTPDGVELAPGETGDVNYAVELGDIEADGYRLVTWPVRARKGTQISRQHPLRVRLTAENSRDIEVAGETPEMAITSPDAHGVYSSGARWVEPTYRLTEATTPTVRLRSLKKTALNPALTIGNAQVQYQGSLRAGEELILGPGRSARMIASSLVVGDQGVLRDVEGPHATKGWDQGNELFNIRMMNPSKPGSKLRITISGKVAGGARSMIRLKGFMLPDSYNPWLSEVLLVDRLKEQWQDSVSHEIVLPPEADVRHVTGYRLGEKGTVWYSNVSVVVADVPAEGADVSNQVQGQLPTLPKLPVASGGQVQRPLLVTYTDESMPATDLPRVEVQLTR